MRRFLVPAAVAAGLAVLVASTGAARATEVGTRRKFGLGLSLGEPTGVTGKYWLSERNALDFGLGFGSYYGFRGRDCWTDAAGRNHCDAFRYGDSSVWADYLWQFNLTRGQLTLDFHAGIGGRAWLWNAGAGDGGLGLSVRGPIGLDFMFAGAPFLEVFVEIIPSIYFFRYGGFGFDAALGVRFYF